MQNTKSNVEFQVIMQRGGQTTRTHIGGAKEIAMLVNGEYIKSSRTQDGKNVIHFIVACNTMLDVLSNMFDVADVRF